MRHICFLKMKEGLNYTSKDCINEKMFHEKIFNV